MANSANGGRGEINPDHFYSLAAIADFLGMCERTTRIKLIHTKIVRAIKVGRRYSIKGAWLIDGLSDVDGEIQDDE